MVKCVDAILILNALAVSSVVMSGLKSRCLCTGMLGRYVGDKADAPLDIRSVCLYKEPCCQDEKSL